MSEQQDPGSQVDEQTDATDLEPVNGAELESDPVAEDPSAGAGQDPSTDSGSAAEESWPQLDDEAAEPEAQADPEPEATEEDVEPEATEEDAEPEPEPEITYQTYDCTIDEEAAIEAAAEAARSAIDRGECIVLPTDTVYGIGADAFSSEAVQALLDAKERGRDMPPPVLIAEPSLIKALAVDVPDAAKALAEAYWPGALTLVFKAQPSLQMDLGETNGTVGLRVPDHKLTRALLRRTGPMAVSSANKSGQPAAVTCEAAIAQLGNDVSVYLDGGPLGDADAQPSTMVDFSIEEHGVILRYGALSLAQIREHCPDVEDLNGPIEDPAAEDESAEGESDESASDEKDLPDSGAEVAALIEQAGAEDPSTDSGSVEPESESVEVEGEEPSTGSGSVDAGSETVESDSESDDSPRPSGNAEG